jgi:hypothetical protein
MPHPACLKGIKLSEVYSDPEQAKRQSLILFVLFSFIVEETTEYACNSWFY